MGLWDLSRTVVRMKFVQKGVCSTSNGEETDPKAKQDRVTAVNVGQRQTVSVCLILQKELKGIIGTALDGK